MQHASPRRAVTAALGVVALAVSLVAFAPAAGATPLAAKSAKFAKSTKSSKSSKSTKSADAKTQKQIKAYVSCMKSHGVNLPSDFGQRLQRRAAGQTNGTAPSTPNGTPPSPPAGEGNGTGNPGFRRGGAFANVNPATLQKAQKACKSKLPKNLQNVGAFGRFRANSKAFNAYATCLKKHGVTLPKNGGVRQLDQSDPTVQSAMQTCAPLRPTFPGGGRGGPGAPGGTNPGSGSPPASLGANG